MWKKIQYSRAVLVWGVGCWVAAAAASAAVAQQNPPTAPAPTRLEVLEQTALPNAQQALQRHQHQCDTLLAVMHARRAMAFADGYNDGSAWQDMEVLVVQCQVTAKQLREQLEVLQAEQAQLRQRTEGVNAEAEVVPPQSSSPTPNPR